MVKIAVSGDGNWAVGDQGWEEKELHFCQLKKKKKKKHTYVHSLPKELKIKTQPGRGVSRDAALHADIFP